MAEEEDQSGIKVGDYVAAKKFGPLEHDFTGEVTKVYTNSVLVEIRQYDPKDKTAVDDMNNRAVVRKSEAKVTAAPKDSQA
ncbi:hypothetical protein FD30_GL000156 [Levilactobacillus namurensis DSM 19117]|uniref:DUF2187 domain-containing protein n=2 Tax=Levilactobacillus namurensis TaxID=380393 RepID=A0A0R1JYZ9_9LACO|nr:DUF2187 domain-containing protein [Levilactobacillus namurensis]PTM23464.1 DUF2187 domain-containing protein [Lactobacillus sp. PFC-70]KRK73780.1 hypothetical protein FD30_GL000156 [Levilactobacillus namurensis DSM 19117]MCW3777980.1 DUF2187 domain-containing protein [Levilactobacillus namurensis]MDT7014815.1 DUF2187 domain-containing protein [Levilactobacillus namurensis]MDT7018328.1 DUF2187 domain-containing protein [Levilactobacillus namurensis]